VHAQDTYPRARRDPLAAAAAVLAVIAFAGSFTHVHAVVAEHGQGGWIGYAIAGMPEASVALVVLKVSRARRTGEPVAWAWLVGVTAAAFTVSANLADAEASGWGYVAAGWPAWSSISALGLMHTGRRAHVHAHTSDTPAVHVSEHISEHASDTCTDTGVHTPEHTSDTPVVHASDTCSDTPLDTGVHTPGTPTVHAVEHTSDTSSDTGVHEDARALREAAVTSVRGAMRTLGCGQGRARRALAAAQQEG